PEVERRAALWMPDAATLVRECDIVLVCVGFDREVRELLVQGGAFSSARRGSVCAVLSTIHPQTIQDLSRQSRAAGLEVIDSTVCRGGDAADRGTLLSFVGGPRPIVAEMAAACGIALPQAEVTREICRALKPRRFKLDQYGR